MTNTDPFANVRKQAKVALEGVLIEIRQREAELERLVAESEQWRAAITGLPSPRSRRDRKTSGAKRPGSVTRARRASPAVNWDDVLSRLPGTFTREDLDKRTPTLSDYPQARVVAVARWARGHKIKKLREGTYRKIH